MFNFDEINFEIIEFVGMNNWVNLHQVAAVSKVWRRTCLPYLSNIGLGPMGGGEDSQLNVPGFLQYLLLMRFRNRECIFIPCGRAKQLYVDDIKAVHLSVKTIVHSKWLMINGHVEEIQEGESCHQFYRIYQHDKTYKEGVNVWICWSWDNKYRLVSELQFVHPSSP